jgi:transposase InsO family protein
VGNGQSEYREERDEGNLETQSAAPSRHCNGQKLGGGALETFSLKTPCILWTVSELNQELKYWEYTYNCIRPHQALGYRTPLQFLKDNGIIRTNYPSNFSHMY